MIRIITNAFGEHLCSHKFKYFLMFFMAACGVVLGFSLAGFAIDSSSIGSNPTAELIQNFCAGGANVSGWGAFWKSLLINYRLLLLIFLAGMLAPTKLLAPLTVGVKSFSMGYALGFTTLMFGGKGFLLAFVSILPQLLTTIPLLVYLSVCALSQQKSRLTWLLRCGFFAGLLAVCSLIDGFIVPVFLSGAGKLF